MKNQPIVLFICFFWTIAALSQSEDLKTKDLNKQAIDSCLSWLRANAYTGEDFEAYHSVGLQNLKRSLETEQDSIIGQIHEELANWHGYNGVFPPDSVVYHSEKALGYYLKGTDQKQIADTYRTLSIDYMNTRQLDKAQEVLFKAIEIYEVTGDDGGLGSAFRSLGVLYMVMEDYQKSVEYTNKAVPLLEKAENYSAVAIAQFNLITGYGELGEFEKAYQAADYCLEVVKTKAPQEIFVPVRAHSYRGEVYIKAKDYDNALKDYVASWELCKYHVGEERCATYRTEIGQVYLLQENYEEALEHLLVGVKAYEDKGQGSIIQPYLDLADKIPITV